MRDSKASESELRPEVATTLDQSVRIDFGMLDVLMNLVGELTLVLANLRVQGERMQRDPSLDLTREILGQLRTMRRRIAELQQGILDVRMVPVRQTFESVRHLVDRTSRGLDKQIELVVKGTQTELDKQIGQGLSKPLVHLINNAIAHGIERPAERVALGKPPVGRIELTAYQQGNRVVIEVLDDGRGIDWRVIRDKALHKRFITADEAAAMDPARAINLIFMPGFSTLDAADTLAGRGVGMDVVKTDIAKLSGLIEVATEPGKGSRFRITLPSTLAVIQALVVESARRTFCIQLSSVLESLMVHDHEVRTIGGSEVVSVRGHTLPLIDLARVFELDEPGGRAGRANRQRYVVVVGLTEHRVGLVVDELLGEQDVVIKPIGRALARVPGISGATELGDNRTVLLLDVAALVNEAIGGVEAMVSGVATGGESIRVSTRLSR